jgi:hypothetical protein
VEVVKPPDIKEEPPTGENVKPPKGENVSGPQ